MLLPPISSTGSSAAAWALAVADLAALLPPFLRCAALSSGTAGSASDGRAGVLKAAVDSARSACNAALTADSSNGSLMLYQAPLRLNTPHVTPRSTASAAR
jgi:hypothetical protein